MRAFTITNFLENIRNGNVTVEEEDGIWNVFDDRDRGSMHSFYKGAGETKEDAIRLAEALVSKHINYLREHKELNERFKCPFCFYQEKVSILNQWSDTEDYFCSEGHNFSIVLHEVNKKN